METRSRMSRSLHTNRDFEKLEPYEGKPSRTVLRGEEGSNALDLPDNDELHNFYIFRLASMWYDGLLPEDWLCRYVFHRAMR